MKLRNKKTGQLGNFIINKDHFECVDLDYVPEYRNLAELNEEWEDYEEPKEWWYIDIAGEVKQGEGNVPEHLIEGMKQVGNYFETKEEAEKAVEKLKAWKRLKEKGFRFDGYDVAHNSNGDLCGQLFYNAGDYCIEDVEKDLDLLFSQEDD